MIGVEWDASMETGDPVVDGQHRGLVELFNEVSAAEQDQDAGIKVPAVLEALCEYVLVHFSAEETLMTRHAYPAELAQPHRQEHQDLTDKTRRFVIDYRSGEFETVEPLVAFLDSWLREHIEHSDRRLVEHVRARPE